MTRLGSTSSSYLLLEMWVICYTIRMMYKVNYMEGNFFNSVIFILGSHILFWNFLAYREGGGPIGVVGS